MATPFEAAQSEPSIPQEQEWNHHWECGQKYKEKDATGGASFVSFGCEGNSGS
jgi:hypothetical protein